jgi:activator of 2-hydroxyglutaryl-CoA dehydratase
MSAIISLIEDSPQDIKDASVTICTTGSGAITLSQKVGMDFEQEVISCTKAVKIFFSGLSIDKRMNETCAGGTGAFIDQMAKTLKTDAAGINELAKNYKTLYPIAASILQPVVNQTIEGLVRVHTIKGNGYFPGGPIFFLSDKSSNVVFNDSINSIASQTVCFAAKMVHGNIENLVKKGIKTIFYTCIPFEVKEFKEANNHYNCPIVSGYPEVIHLNSFSCGLDALNK